MKARLKNFLLRRLRVNVNGREITDLEEKRKAWTELWSKFEPTREAWAELLAACAELRRAVAPTLWFLADIAAYTCLVHVLFQALRSGCFGL